MIKNEESAVAMTVMTGGGVNDSVFVREFCHTTLRKLLTGAGVSADDAQVVAAEVARRAQMLAALPAGYFDVLVTPFLEEVSEHRPRSAPAWLRAAVAVVVRNSHLENFHALGGPLDDAHIAAITEAAAGPLAELLQEPSEPVKNNVFAGFNMMYPRAWACLTALSDLMASDTDTQRAYTMPEGPRPQLPGMEETVHAREASGLRPMVKGQAVVASGIDPRFDQALMMLMRQAKEGAAELVPLSALSRLSRNSSKQLRVLEFLLAHRTTVLTTNYLLAPALVGARTRPLVKPDSYDLRRSMKNLRGLGPAHTRWVKALRRQR
ncbi:hypothetical protein AB0I84_10815 [Streptomyces spectabilis]|uniref:hypothetical protein n=1 Tax=Streptomyces spectabilis TaxID=68270 RepID=UPI003406990E